MRGILFRGKSIATNEWVTGNLIQTALGEPYIAPLSADIGDVHGLRVDPETVGQYTGLNDADDNSIYEGDVMEFELIPRKYVIGFVEWEENQALFLTRLSARNTTGIYTTGRIIGNIHDNPELLDSINIRL